MSTTKAKKPAAEAVEEIKTIPAGPEGTAGEALGGQEDAPAISCPEDGPREMKRSQEEQDKEFFARLHNPCVYCGPSVRGVARQFTVYTGGIPDALKEFIKEHRAAKWLLVSVERFAQVRTRLETPGTGEFILFRKVRDQITHGRLM